MSAPLRAPIGAAILCLSIASWAVAQELPLVFVEQSEGLVEMQIDDYLRKTEGFTITIDEYDGIPDDLFLRFENTFRDAPELSFLVDTLQSATDNDDVVTERVIKITSWYILNVTPGHWARAPVLEMINTFSQEFWAPPKIYLDDDGDIRFEWSMKLSSPGAGNASTIRRRFLYSDALGITFRVDEEMDRYAKSWEILTHGDYILTRID